MELVLVNGNQETSNSYLGGGIMGNWSTSSLIPHFLATFSLFSNLKTEMCTKWNLESKHKTLRNKDKKLNLLNLLIEQVISSIIQFITYIKFLIIWEYFNWFILLSLFLDKYILISISIFTVLLSSLENFLRIFLT